MSIKSLRCFILYNCVCFTGYRPKKYNFTTENKKLIYQKLVIEVSNCVQYGYDTFYFGTAPGFDLLAAHVIIYLKRIFEITLIGVLPYENFHLSKEFDECWRNDYLTVLKKCDKTLAIGTQDSKNGDPYMMRNKFMIDNSRILICFYDGKKGGTQNSIHYAQQKGLRIVNILPL